MMPYMMVDRHNLKLAEYTILSKDESRDDNVITLEYFDKKDKIEFQEEFKSMSKDDIIMPYDIVHAKKSKLRAKALEANESE